MLSLSIDFYVRVFVRIRSSPLGAKRASANTAVVYCCHGCSSTHVQALARAVGTTGNETFKNASGPPMATNKCDECGSGFAVGGPMWAGSLHDRTFVKRMLEHVNEATPAPTYGTLPRLKGMLAVAHSVRTHLLVCVLSKRLTSAQELDVPFYFTSSTVAGHFHCTAPSLNAFACVCSFPRGEIRCDSVRRSALLHAGYDVSRSHAAAGSIKTTAPRTVIHDIMRAWIKDHPVTLNNIKDGSPARPLLAKESTSVTVAV